MEETVFFVEDRELGRIKLRSNSRARRFVFRCTEEGLVCTLPVRARHSDLLRAIEQLRPRLKAMQERAAARCANRQHFTSSQIEDLRKQAKMVLPLRLKDLSAVRGLRFQKVSIHKSRTRWGSCSSKGNISLSLYLMLLPPHLQDYVMQHELTHLVEMNHGPRFWALLDEATAGKSLLLRAELKKYSKSVF